jgi:hypothetical protein
MCAKRKPVTKSERFLKMFLRAVGSAALLAIVAVFMPYSWMNAIHRGLGMGVLPAAPVVGYLARSTSAFYAVIGGLAWLVSFDLRRYASITLYLGMVFVCLGIGLFGIDFVEGMPAFWTWGEGPINLAMGLGVLILRRGVPFDVRGSAHSPDNSSA